MPASGTNPPQLPSSWNVLPPRTVVRRAVADVPTSATAEALATRTAPAAPMTFGAPAGSPHVVRRFHHEGEPDMSIDDAWRASFAEFDNSGVDKGVEGLYTPSGSGYASYGDPEFREAVLRIVEERLEEETDRRAWRRGSEVF
ncbi:hypothetical protein CTE05_18680 [Cellulomonas terrae]|uniref:Uncharacterized protein n=1 Tax=Cellulomonas terrae TaxID=311234 RepID=A0A511JJZ3_9CELL|nr:hypothetical protein CTE05_18680 [Cellulomonas terrae]